MGNMEIDYFHEENELTRKLFDLDDIINFQFRHDIQIIREVDGQYMCYIDKKGYGCGLTTMGALVIGIKQFKNKQNDKN
jgi:hypothetical protein